MELIENLIQGFPNQWGGGVAHSVLILALVITIGIALGKIKVGGISLGATWIMFVGIAFGHFNLNIDPHLLHFLKELGLILFVYSIGLQVGPGFFSAFKKGGLTLNLLAVGSVLTCVGLTIALHYGTGTPITTLAGVLSGAVTNTPGLGAAQQAFNDMHGTDAPEIAMGYAVAYPLGVVGAIVSLVALKHVLRLNTKQEREEAERGTEGAQNQAAHHFSVLITNSATDGKAIKDLRPLVNRRFVVSRVRRAANDSTELVNRDTVLHCGDRILVIASAQDHEAIEVFFGNRIQMQWETEQKEFVSRRIIITKSHLNGKTLAELNLRKNLSVSITRINRSGLDLVAAPNLRLQIGDRVTVVGTKMAIEDTEKLLGNSIKRLDHPNLIPIFLGIAIGCVFGSIPFAFPGIPQPVKLGLAGGPLIVSILISRFGPQYKLVTYSTTSANLMIREMGISLFLACVGLGAGKDFVETIVNQGGLTWIAYGAAITIVPLLIWGFIGRRLCHVNYYTLIGVLSGANTNPPALSFSNEQIGCDAPAVGYATVYPLSMFLRVLTAQMLILSMT